MEQADLDALKQIVDDWDTAMNTADVDATLALYVDEDPLAMPPHAPAGEGKEGIRQVIEGLHAQGKVSVNDEFVAAEISGDLAVMRGTYTLTITPGEGASMEDAGKWVCACRRTVDGEWKTVYNIWNSDHAMPN